MVNLHVKETGCPNILNQFESNKKTHKYGIKIPTSVDHAYKIDKKNKDKFWRHAFCKDMKNVGITLEILDHYCPVIEVRKKVIGHME